MSDETSQRNALEAWARVLGSENVISEPAILRAAETATFEISRRIPVILRPANSAEVSEVLRIASGSRFPVYVISSGRNWGYGSRLPSSTGCAIIDLSRLNRITAFDEALGYVTVQPGVRQQDLFDFLRQRNSSLWMDATGASPECSLIGNAMERGFGHTPYSDHFGQACGLEVVLPSGETVRTGHAGLPGARSGAVYRWGLGPSIDGLFSQSNYGVVTEMTIWLMPAPEYFQAFFLQADSENGLASIVDALRPLRLDGTLRSAIHVANDYKVLAGIQQFPWGEQMPLSPERMSSLRQELKFSRWSASGGLYGTKKQVAEARRMVRQALRGKADRVQFLDERLLELASRFKGVYRMLTGLDLTRTLDLARPVFSLLKGVPTRQPLASAYWRKRSAVPADPDPDRDRCGLLWTAPIAPMRGEDAERMRVIAESVLLAWGFEPQLSFTLLTERSIACIVSITYDRQIPGEDRKAMDCYRELLDKLAKAGYYSYRLAVAGMESHVTDKAYNQLLRALKRAVDPAEILAPGRYVPAGAAR